MSTNPTETPSPDVPATPGGRGMRILVDNGDYWLANRGDLATIRVTVDRLLDIWPEAEVAVLTAAPARLPLYCPRAVAAPAPGAATGGASASVARRLAGAPSVLEATLQLRRLQRGRRESEETAEQPDTTLPHPWDLPGDTVDADVVVAAGGGYLADADPEQTRRTLRLLGDAQRSGKGTLMFSQGIGPIEDPDLRALAAEVLPSVDLIATREGLSGPALLADLGVDDSRIIVTGDDAIELAHASRSTTIGSEIGICFRLVDYMGLDAGHTQMVRTGVVAAARRHGARLVPINISEYSDEDRIANRGITDGQHTVADRRPDAPPAHAVRRVGRCRVLVTAAYHAGVFALSQGIPIVALTRSAYYDWKFAGLADRFGGGCEIVDLSADDVAGRLDAAIDRAWTGAARGRLPLLAAAARQISEARGAYLHARQMIESKKRQD